MMLAIWSKGVPASAPEMVSETNMYVAEGGGDAASSKTLSFADVEVPASRTRASLNSLVNVIPVDAFQRSKLGFFSGFLSSRQLFHSSGVYASYARIHAFPNSHWFFRVGDGDPEAGQRRQATSHPQGLS